MKIVIPNFSTEIVVKKFNWVAPTLGTLFTFDTNKSIQFSKIEVLTSTGVQIQSIDPSQTSQWDASFVNEGIYFLIAHTKEGIRTTQKVIVKR